MVHVPDGVIIVRLLGGIGPEWGRATIVVSADVAVGRVTGRPGPCAGRFGDVGSPAGILQVTDTAGSVVGVSGIDGPTGFDLRCQIREALVSYLQREHPEALPWSNRRGSPTPPSDAVPNHSDPVPCCP